MESYVLVFINMLFMHFPATSLSHFSCNFSHSDELNVYIVMWSSRKNAPSQTSGSINELNGIWAIPGWNCMGWLPQQLPVLQCKPLCSIQGKPLEQTALRCSKADRTPSFMNQITSGCPMQGQSTNSLHAESHTAALKPCRQSDRNKLFNLFTYS